MINIPNSKTINWMGLKKKQLLNVECFEDNEHLLYAATYWPRGTFIFCGDESLKATFTSVGAQ